MNNSLKSLRVLVFNNVIFQRMGFGSYGAPGMGFGAGPHGSTFNQVGNQEPNSGSKSGLEPDIPGEDPPLPPGDDCSTSHNGANAAMGSTNSGKTPSPTKNIQPLMGAAYQPWAATPSANIQFASSMAPTANVPPGFNSVPSQVLSQGVGIGLSKKALKKKRKKEREEAQAAALQAKSYAQAVNPSSHNIPPPPGPPPLPNNPFAATSNNQNNNAMNVENWPDSLR